MSILADTADLFVKPVTGHDDVIAFQFPFQLEGKAETGAVTALDDGDLIIEGWAAVFEGDDRQGENFTDGAFTKGIKGFMNGSASLCFHHKSDIVLGEVLDLHEVEGKGLYMKARVDHQPESSPHRWIYNAVKKRSMKGLSVGGFFKRAYIEGKRKIVDMDFTEVSITGVPVHSGPKFAIVAGKALDSGPIETAAADDAETFDFQLPEGLMERLEETVQLLEAKALPKKHEPDTADLLGTLLQKVGGLRRTAGSFATFGENDELKALADSIETAGVEWEATAHKLAAKIGPLPPVETNF